MKSETRSVAELIDIPKYGRAVRQVPKKLGHAQLNVAAEAEDGTKFAVFVRVLIDLPESFSIGLAVLHPNGNTILFRLNGDHGDHGNDPDDVFDGPHIHQPTDAQRAAPPAPGTKPRFAVQITMPVAPSLGMFWPMFKDAVHLHVDNKVDRKISKIYKDLAQEDLGLSDDDDDDTDDDAGGTDGGSTEEA